MSWRWICTAFGQKFNDLCSALASVARRICTTYVDPSNLIAHTSCCLVPLDKGPRYVTSSDWRSCSQDYWESCHENCQAWSSRGYWSHSAMRRTKSGCEAAVHAMKRIFAKRIQKQWSWWMLQMHSTDGTDITLINCEAICPAMSHVLINTYQKDSEGGGTCWKRLG